MLCARIVLVRVITVLSSCLSSVKWVCMMDNKELNEHCEKCGLTESGIEMVHEIRKGEPVRRVSSNGRNLTARFASLKMRMTVQTESKLELAKVYDLEVNSNCLEYYTQAARLTIDLGEKTVSHVPDVFSIETLCFIFYETKTVDKLNKLIEEKPEQYSYDEVHQCYRSVPVQGGSSRCTMV